MKTKLYRTFTWAVACCLSLLFAVQTKAQSDPSTLHIGPGAGTPCAMGCAGDPNLIGSGNTVDIFQQSAGAPSLNQPLLLILGIPNNSTNLFGSNPITGVTFINPYPGGTSTIGSSAFAAGGTYGLISPVAGGFFGSMGAGQEVYSFLTLNGPNNNSNSFTNWAAADFRVNGITATGFGIYVFALSGAALGPHGLVNITFSPGSLPLGTFVVAYGNASGTPFNVPFTEAGLVIPEPGSMALFGTGLLVLGGALRRRWHRQV